MTQITYRGWTVDKNFIGQWEAVGPNYDASWEGEEDGWVDNGQKVTAMTLEGLQGEVDVWIEENPQ